MKKIILAIIVVLILVGCSGPRMMYQAPQSERKVNLAQYKKNKKGDRNLLITFTGCPGYYAKIYSKDIVIRNKGIFAYEFLDLEIQNGSLLLIEEADQGKKKVKVELIPLSEYSRKTDSKFSKQRKRDRRVAWVEFTITEATENIEITEPKQTMVQIIVDVGAPFQGRGYGQKSTNSSSPAWDDIQQRYFNK